MVRPFAQARVALLRLLVQSPNADLFRLRTRRFHRWHNLGQENFGYSGESGRQDRFRRETVQQVRRRPSIAGREMSNFLIFRNRVLL